MGGVLICFLCAGPKSVPSPPRIKLLRSEPAEITDASGSLMQLVTLGVAHSDQASSFKGGHHDWQRAALHIRNASWSFGAETRKGDSDGEKFPTWIGPGEKKETMILVPMSARSLRLDFEYTDSRPTFAESPIRGRLLYVCEALPRVIVQKLPKSFWPWLLRSSRGAPYQLYTRFIASPVWHEAAVEIKLGERLNASE